MILGTFLFIYGLIIDIYNQKLVQHLIGNGDLCGIAILFNWVSIFMN